MAEPQGFPPPGYRLLPPKALRRGGGDFVEVGQEFLRHFVKIGRLQPDEDVLDMGCGVGRIIIDRSF
jgi:hypothetical protein